MIYSINITRRTQKELSNLPLNIQEKVIKSIKNYPKILFLTYVRNYPEEMRGE